MGILTTSNDYKLLVESGTWETTKVNDDGLVALTAENYSAEASKCNPKLQIGYKSKQKMGKGSRTQVKVR